MAVNISCKKTMYNATYCSNGNGNAGVACLKWQGNTLDSTGIDRLESEISVPNPDPNNLACTVVGTIPVTAKLSNSFISNPNISAPVGQDQILYTCVPIDIANDDIQRLNFVRQIWTSYNGQTARCATSSFTAAGVAGVAGVAATAAVCAYSPNDSINITTYSTGLPLLN